MTSSHASAGRRADEAGAAGALERAGLVGGVASIEAVAAQPPWPEGIPQAPPPGTGRASLGPYLTWLESARRILADREASNAVELDGLQAQWAHVLHHIDRLRPEEITAVHDGQARIRERLATDAALGAVLAAEHERLTAWAEALGGPLTDPVLVRRLLDDAVAERERVGREILSVAMDALSNAALDLEVGRREVERDPAAAGASLAALRERVAAAADALRDVGGPADVRRQPGEPLALTLQRAAEQRRSRVRAKVVWNGPDVLDPEVADAVLGVVLECLRHLASVGGPVCDLGVTVEAGAPGVAMRLVTPSEALLPDGDPAWLVRSRARVAVASGRLVCGRADLGSFVESRFP